MTTVVSAPHAVAAIAFEQLIQHGVASGAQLRRSREDGPELPWSFTYNGEPITHEADDCYLIGAVGAKMGPDDVLITDSEGALHVCPREILKDRFPVLSTTSTLPDGPKATRYEISATDVQDLENRFSYHAPKGDQVNRYGFLRSEALALAKAIAGTTPPGRERALALTHLETAIFFANAAIARHE